MKLDVDPCLVTLYTRRKCADALLAVWEIDASSCSSLGNRAAVAVSSAELPHCFLIPRK